MKYFLHFVWSFVKKQLLCFLPKLAHKVIERGKYRHSFAPHLFNKLVVNFAWKRRNIFWFNWQWLSQFFNNRKHNFRVIVKTSNIHDGAIQLSIKFVNANLHYFIEEKRNASSNILKHQNVIFFKFRNDFLLKVTWKNVHVSCFCSIWQYNKLLSIPKRCTPNSLKFHCMQATNIFCFFFRIDCMAPLNSWFQRIHIEVFRNCYFMFI